MSLERTFVLTGAPQMQLAMAVVGQNWAAMAQAGHPLAVRLYEHKDRRTLEQQSLLWIRLQEIAEQAWVGGRQFDAETWAEHFKREFLPDEEGPTKRCRKEYRKWVVLPSGARELVGSTTRLTTFGFAEYLTQIMAYAATELGVHFSASRSEA